MRYIGNKTRILEQIDKVVKTIPINGGVFADIFSGSGAVSDYFKDRFEIIANDYMTYASLFSGAKIFYAETPKFDKFINSKGVSPFVYWRLYDYSKEAPGFITREYSPLGNRMFFQEKNAIVIDTIRRQIEEFFQEGLFSEKERVFLIASLLENVMTVSNTSGTYEAYFNSWERRSFKDLELKPLEMEQRVLYSENNKVYSEDSNLLAKKIKGDIVYIDPPYTVTQYTSAYHLLETIAKYDTPMISGKTGRRQDRIMSMYSRRREAIRTFEDLLRQLDFNHIIISYSNQSLIEIKELKDLIRLFSYNNEITTTKIGYREYRNLNASQKGKGQPLEEYLIYFKKDREIIKSPLNYSGSKCWIMDRIIKELPQNITYFIDAMGGAFNVGANIHATKGVVYNEYIKQIFDVKMQFLTKDLNVIYDEIKYIIDKYKLEPANKEAYLQLRNNYNSTEINKRNPLELYVLTLFSFQHMIRFNAKGDYNVPVGNSGFTEDIKIRLKQYRTKSPIFKLSNKSFEEIDYKEFDKDSLFYFDPPYIVTNTVYNDGKRMNSQWTVENEILLLEYLDELNKNGYKFMLSNVLEHNGKENQILIDWINNNNYKVVDIGETGRRYKRTEVIIKNYGE